MLDLKSKRTMIWALNQAAYKAQFVICFTLVSSLTYSSALKMEEECSSETSADFQQTAWRYIEKDNCGVVLFDSRDHSKFQAYTTSYEVKRKAAGARNWPPSSMYEMPRLGLCGVLSSRRPVNIRDTMCLGMQSSDVMIAVRLKRLDSPCVTLIQNVSL
jgi:hypothetical protein